MSEDQNEKVVTLEQEQKERIRQFQEEINEKVIENENLHKEHIRQIED